ncbi:MAG TPA: hypothetical protein VG013_05250 [Gemmataceae bacterium]|jgi:hypothetical protein|nr:hypothetical protein [Gemmataceae bacterium]
MDATRTRRLKDHARQNWYSTWRCVRFARHMGIQAPAMATGSFSVLLTGPSRAGEVGWAKAERQARA